MSVIWSGITEQGAIVPVQVDETGKVIATAAVPDGPYVRKTGDNMTGDLTFDTDKITLNDNGNATFSGETNVGDIYTDGGVRFLPRGEIYLREDEAAVGVFTVSSGGLALSDQTISLLSNGSATFKNYINTVGYNAEPANAVDSGITVRNPSGGQISVDIKGDGSAQFGGAADRGVAGIQLYSGGEIDVTNASGQAQLWKGRNNTDLTSTITADGSADFAGGKCGFTSSGELFFTSRNSRYKLVVQDQLVLAEPYTRQMELKEKVEQFIADKRETKPSQGGVDMDIDNSSPKEN